MIRILLVPDYRIREVLSFVGMLAITALMSVAANSASSRAKIKNGRSNTKYNIPDSILIVTIIWG